MDDVLSSIRRIIGAEKRDGYDDLPGADAPDAPQDPLTLGAPIREGNPARIGGGGAERAEAPADPLSLTPNMRVDFTRLTREDETAAPRRPLPAHDPAPEPARMAAAAAEDDGQDDGMVIDEAALEELIRRVVREELDAREGAGGADDDTIRRVLREELAGETGRNISRNVQKLIQAEVARLVGNRG